MVLFAVSFVANVACARTARCRGGVLAADGHAADPEPAGVPGPSGPADAVPVPALRAALLHGGRRLTASPSSSSSATGSRPTPPSSRSLDAILSGLVGLPGSYDFQSEFIERVFRGSMLGLGIVGVGVALALLFRPIVAHPQQDEDAWDHASRLVHAYGSRHAGLLRPARRQELLLLVRRRGHDRLHLHRALRPRPRATRSVGPSRSTWWSTSSSPCAGSGPGAWPSSPCSSRTATATSTGACTPSTWATRPSWSARASASRARSGRASASPAQRVERTYRFE